MLNKRQAIYTRFAAKSEQFDNKEAILHGSLKCTYGELRTRCDYLSEYINKKSKIVATWLNPGIDLVTAALAIFKANRVYLPLNGDMGYDRVQDVFAITGCDAVITNNEAKDDCLEAIEKLNLPVKHIYVISDGKHVTKCSPHNHKQLTTCNGEVHLKDNNDGCYIFYTSGTTGAGKAILGSCKSLLHFLDWEIETFDISSENRVSMLSSITFDASLRDILVPLLTGATLCIPEKKIKNNLSELVNWIDSVAISIIHCVPSVFRLIMKELEDQNNIELKNLKHILMAGEPLYAKDVGRWRSCIGDHVELINLYGTTETTLAKTFHRIAEIPEVPSQAIHAGQPINNTFIAIINSNNKLCKIGEIGEIYIKTPFSTYGYINNNELNQKVFVQNPLVEQQDIIYKTGDMGRYLSERDIEVLGRTDSQVKVNGVRVELEEIEQALLSNDHIEMALAVPYVTKDSQVTIVAYFVGNEVDEEELKAQLRKRLGSSLVPAYLKRMDELPLNINGKIDKKGLPSLGEIMEEYDSNYDPPVNNIEKSLEAIWKEVLGIKRASRCSSFFQIGGTSLRCLQVISMIFKKFQVLIKVSEFFDKPTIADLAEHIKVEKEVTFSSIPKLPSKKYYDLSHAQRRMWIVDQVSAERRISNVPNPFQLKGSLDVDTFKKSVLALIERHESLRTCFITVDTEPKQVIKAPDEINFEVEVIDLREDPDRELKVYECLKNESLWKFNLEEGPLIRAQLLQTEDDCFTFIFTLHHIVTDGWSLEVLTNDLFVFYDYFSGGESTSPKPLEIQYKDYAEWHNCQLSTKKLKEHRKYWSTQFGNGLPEKTLTTDFSRPDIMTYAGKTQSCTIDDQSRKKLQLYCNLHNVSLFMFFQTVWLVILYNQFGKTDVVIGSPVAGREHPDVKDQVGLFMNTVLLRTRFDSGDKFSNLLQNVRKSVIEALDHSAYPFDLMLKELNLNMDKNRNPLYDIGYTYINELDSGERNKSNFKSIDVKYLSTDFEFIKADLWYKVLELSDDLIIDISYNINLFKESTVSKMLLTVNYIIEKVLRGFDGSIDELSSLIKEGLLDIQAKNKRSVREKNLSLLREIIA